MPVIGVIALWAAYTAGLWGYCLVRGYNVSLPQLLSQTWPPPAATNTDNPPSSGGVQPNPPSGANIPGYGPGGTTKTPGPGSAYGGK